VTNYSTHFLGEGDKNQKSIAKGKAKNDPSKSAGRGGKGGKGKEKVEETNEPHGEEETQPPPPPLSIKLEITLERLNCTKDALESTNKS
jgi:hypothetical protein